MVHVSVKAEELFSLLGVPITNSMLLSWIVLSLFLILGVWYSRVIHQRNKPSFFYLIHKMLEAVYSLIHSVLHEKAVFFYPLLGAYFFYILFNNWMGMIPTVGSLLIKPSIEKTLVHSQQKNENTVYKTIKSEVQRAENILGESIQRENTSNGLDSESTQSKSTHEKQDRKIPMFRANTADLNTTFALALVTVFMIQYYGFTYNGIGYSKKFINLSSPILFFVGILELISELARILSFSFRLFGNVLAGEILISIVAFLLPSTTSFIMIPFYTLELMAGAIQALVFMMLSTVLIGMATTKTQH